MRALSAQEEIDWRFVGRAAFAILFAFFVFRDLQLLGRVLAHQPLGLDFLPVWTAGRADPARLYDFAYLTANQDWLYADKLRPFVYPPSALLILGPFSIPPFWVGYGAFVACTTALFVWAGRRLGASWLMVLPPPVFLVPLAGQTTFLVSGLVMTAVTLKKRPILAGVLYGVVGTMKPHMLVLLPLALLAERNWRAFWATGATTLGLVLLSLPTGASWSDWLVALPRFHELVAADAGLSATVITPFTAWGPASLIVTAPAAIAAVWFAFRSDSLPARVIALLGGALAVSPYAMNYELAVLIPAVLAFEKRASWTLLFWATVALAPDEPVALIIALMLLFRGFAREAPPARAAPASGRMSLETLD